MTGRSLWVGEIAKVLLAKCVSSFCGNFCFDLGSTSNRSLGIQRVSFFVAVLQSFVSEGRLVPEFVLVCGDDAVAVDHGQICQVFTSSSS